MTPLGRSEPKYPKPYEYAVQLVLQRLRVPLKSRFTVRIGEDDEGIAAVCVSEEIVRGVSYELNYGAIACHLRGGDGTHAQEMLDDTMEQIVARCVELGATEAEAYGYIDPENTASQKMASRFGLVYDHDDGTDSGARLQVWTTAVFIPGPVAE